MRAGPVAGSGILFQANSLEVNILATLCPGEDVDGAVDITFSLIVWTFWIWNFRISRATDRIDIKFIPVITDYAITAKMLYRIGLTITVCNSFSILEMTDKGRIIICSTFLIIINCTYCIPDFCIISISKGTLIIFYNKFFEFIC